MSKPLKLILTAIIFTLFIFFASSTQAFFFNIPKSLEKILSSTKNLQGEIGNFEFNVPVSSPGGGQTCNINGVEMPGPCPVTPIQPSTPEKQSIPNIMAPEKQMESETTTTPIDEEMQKQQKAQEEQRIKDIKRNFKQMESSVKKFEQMLNSANKKGIEVPQEIKDEFARSKEILAAADKAQTMEELENIDMNELQGIIQDLEQARNEIFDKAQRLQDIKRSMKPMESNLKTFEKQLAKITKLGLKIPSDTSENITQLKKIINTVKNAKTWDEVEESGIEDINDLMQTFEENRMTLEMLARWPQTKKQATSELKRLTTQLKKSKSIIVRLNKKGIDITSIYNEFEDMVNKMKSAITEAETKIKNGEIEDAFNLLDNDFFGQMEDVWQNQRIIEMMSNLGRFQSEYKQNISKSSAEIKRLKKKGLDIKELESILSQVKQKGEEILGLIKAKPIDEDEVSSALQDLENLKQEFDLQASELRGESEERPWEKGAEQFKSIQVPSTLNKILPTKKVETTQPVSPQ